MKKEMLFETRTRKVKQSYRRFTDEQKKDIINQIDNRPSDISKSEMFLKFGLGEKGGSYYVWKERFGQRATPKRISPSGNVRMNVPMTVKSGRRIHTVTLRIEVDSIMELISFYDNIKKSSKIKSISVE